MAEPSDVKYAGFWRRLIAFNIDTFVLFTIQICLMAIATFLSENLGIDIAALLLLLTPLVFLLYYAAMESSYFQGTLGKVLIGLAVTDTDGKRISFLRATGRNLGKILSTAILSIGYLLAAFTRRKQALHDMPANCLVIQERESSLFKLFLILILFFFLSMVVLFGIVGAFVYGGFKQTMQGFSSQGMGNVEFNTSMESFQSEPRPEQVKQTATISAGDRKLSLLEYESLLSGEVPVVETEGPTTVAGPFLLEVATFFPDQFWLKVYAQNLPNFGDGLVKGLVNISSLTDTSGTDYYDPNNNFESDFFRKIEFQKSPFSGSYAEATRSVHYTKGLTEANLDTVKGEIVLSLPINIDSAAFSADEVGQQRQAANSTVSFDSAEGSSVNVRYSGLGKNYIKVLAFNEAGDELASSSRSLMTETGQIETTMFNEFQGIPARIEVLVAEDVIEKRYPFEISK